MKKCAHELEKALGVFPVAYLALGPLEWHGEHLAFGADPIRAQHVLTQVWRRKGGVLLPALHVGTDGHQRLGKNIWWGMEQFAKLPLPGSLYISESSFRALIRDTAASLSKAGFKLAVFFTGHEAPNQVEALKNLERESRGRPMKVMASWAGRVPYPQALLKDRPEPDGHAGATESSELMAVDSKLLALQRAGVKPRDRRVGLTKATLSPKHVRVALGRARFEIQVKWICDEMKKWGF